ncbi:MAG: polysaccharide deacetylase [Azospira oryzae]|nr:MAG: polysaccharide deacetylase [Azospira oryzae]
MILLSFDVEEFDVPDEFGFPLPLKDQIEISKNGLTKVLDILLRYNVKATFYTTVVFARHAPDILARMISEGHELESHSVYHGQFSEEDLLASKEELEALAGVRIKGFRMPRMMPVSDEAIEKAGYLFNSSLHPTWIPGRYNHLSRPRTTFYVKKVLQLPASVTPIIRFPLFWITFHVLPMWLYNFFCRWTLKKDGYLNLYFHPWEFVDLAKHEEFTLPFYITQNSGEALCRRLAHLITHFQSRGDAFGRTDELFFNELNSHA